MERPLGTFETAATLTGEHAPFVVVVVLQLTGGPTLERLRTALDTLQRHHPILRMRILERSGRYGFEGEGTPEIPLRQVERADGAAWLEAAEDELNRRLDITRGPLLRCTYLAPREEGADCEILLAFHHVVMDAVSGAPLLRQLVALCDPAREPEPPADPSLPLAGPRLPRHSQGLRGGLQLLSFLARQIGDELAYRYRSRGGRKPPVVEASRCRVLPVQLSEDATSSLIRNLRRQRATLNAALSAALLLAVFRHLYSGQAGPLRYITFADLRPYLEPPVPIDSLGSFITLLRYTVPLQSGRGFWQLAREISEQVDAGARRGDKFCSVRMSAWTMRKILAQRKQRMATTALSYSGVTHLEPAEGPVGVRSMRAFVSNFGLGPEYTAQARWFRGQLLLDIVYLDSDMDATLARTLADDILETLRRAGSTE